MSYWQLSPVLCSQPDSGMGLNPVPPLGTPGPALGPALILTGLFLGLGPWHVGCPLPAELSPPPPQLRARASGVTLLSSHVL